MTENLFTHKDDLTLQASKRLLAIALNHYIATSENEDEKPYMQQLLDVCLEPYKEFTE